VSRQSIKIAALLITAALLTSACGIGFNAGTNQQKASGNGRSADIGSIQVRGALIVIDPKKPGWGTFVGTIINTAPEKDKFLGVELYPADGTSSRTQEILNTQEPAQFGTPGYRNLPVRLSTDVKAGTLINVLLDFKTNSAIPMKLLVENNDGIYSDIGVGYFGG
jgi:copper(I)-binding protein